MPIAFAALALIFWGLTIHDGVHVVSLLCAIAATAAAVSTWRRPPLADEPEAAEPGPSPPPPPPVPEEVELRRPPPPRPPPGR